MKQVAFSIDYDEPDQDSYRGFVVSVKNVGDAYEKRKEYRFYAGFPPLDLIDAHNFMISKIGAENILACNWRSSVDHFTMDGDKYEWYTDDGEWLRATKKFEATKEFKDIKKKLQAERNDL